MTRDGAHRRLLAGVLPLDRATVAIDIVAGVTLAAIAIPEVMGYASIARMPVVTGLYTILLPLAVFAVFASSRHLVVGADSATAAILAAGLIGTSVAPGSDQWVALSATVAIMAGVWLIIARYARLGFIADFLSATVLVGFLTGVGIQVAIGQIPAMLGIGSTGTGVVDAVASLANAGRAHLPTLAVSLSVAAVIGAGKVISRRFPAALIAVILSIIAGQALKLGSKGVTLIGSIAAGLPSLSFPDVSPTAVWRLVPLSLSIFVVILAQSAATSRAYATKHGESLSMDQDLMGLGMANIAAGLSGTFMVAGSPTKTQIVDSAGGRSQLAQITTALVVLVTVAFLTAPFEYLPVSALATVVFVIGIELIDVVGLLDIYEQRPVEFWVAVTVAITVVVVGVEQGLVVAFVLSLVAHTRHSYRPRNNLVAKARGNRGSTEVFPVEACVEAAPGLMIYRFTHDMYYANATTLYDEVVWLTANAHPTLAWFCVDLAAVTDVDYTAAMMLRRIHATLRSRNVSLVFCHASDLVRHDLDVSGVTDLVGDRSYFRTTGSVIDAYDGRTRADLTADPQD